MIEKLPAEVVRRIASGQIASSPTAVLKELLENSLDAGATEISVKVENPFNFRVVDNGCGIDYRELPLTVERFATSKIRDLKDLKQLKTYGFRGEALHAISQFSRLTIKSSKGNGTGGKIVVKGGAVEEYTPIPYRKGTSVSVEELFFNAPVRRKAVSRKERSSLFKLLKTYALSNPNVFFSFNDKVFPRASLKERIFQLFGKDWELLEVNGERFHLLYSREKKGLRFTFVNKRPVELPEAEKLLEEKGIKSWILFIRIPPELVDPNITPTKEKVYIEDKNYLREIEESLSYSLNLPRVSAVREKREIEYFVKPQLIGSDGTVLIAHDPENYYFFDIHLIHERVNYEELLEKLKNGEIPTVELLKEVELPIGSEEKLKRLGVGFRVEGNTVYVERIPEILSVEDIKELSRKSVESVAEIACRRAVKSGYRILEFEELEKLFERFLKCRNRETCPHGRPIYYKMKKEKIYSQLGRKLKVPKSW